MYVFGIKIKDIRENVLLVWENLQKLPFEQNVCGGDTGVARYKKMYSYIQFF